MGHMATSSPSISTGEIISSTALRDNGINEPFSTVLGEWTLVDAINSGFGL